jgi:hypothetical protein
MSKVYMLSKDMGAASLQRLRCADESKELQDLLEQNPHLLPGEQIYPEDPPQWLLIKREMPVTDPVTGTDRWSVDFLFVDHMAIPTLVECKRCDDTRARREVIAQMLEYAANGHHYWSADELQAYAQKTAGGLANLDAWISRHNATGGTAKDFFGAVNANLRKATMRLIFFLEESPNELRSLVDFLNGQLKETEVLLVEARLYDSPSGRIVVPWLFGYTEEARVAKRESRSQVARLSSERGELAYTSAVEQSILPQEVKSAIRTMLDTWPSAIGGAPGWVFGANAIFLVPAVMKTRGLFHLARSGDVSLYFGYWNPGTYNDVGPEQERLKNAFAEGVQKLFDVQFSDKQLQAFPTIKASQWVAKLPEFVALIKRIAPWPLVDVHPGHSTSAVNNALRD